MQGGVPEPCRSRVAGQLTVISRTAGRQAGKAYCTTSHQHFHKDRYGNLPAVDHGAWPARTSSVPARRPMTFWRTAPGLAALILAACAAPNLPEVQLPVDAQGSGSNISGTWVGVASGIAGEVN